MCSCKIADLQSGKTGKSFFRMKVGIKTPITALLEMYPHLLETSDTIYDDDVLITRILKQK